MVNKKKTALFVFGCVALAITALLLIYGILVATGVVHLKQNKLVFAAGNADKYYDGTPLSTDDWILESGKLQKGHRVVAVVNGSQTLPGKGANNMTVTIYDENDVDVTDDYTIEYVPGVLYVRGINLVFTSGSAVKEYDGTPLTKAESHLAVGTPLPGHKVTHRAVGTITDIGETENIIEISITDASGQDVSHYYEPQFQYGILKVSKAPLTVITYGDSKEYDGKPLTNTDYQLIGTLRPGHVAAVEVIGTITNPGEVDNRAVVKVIDNATGQDVTNMYDITYDLGKLTVVPGDMQGGGGGEGPGGEGPGGGGPGSGGPGGTLGGADDLNQGDSGESYVDFFNFTSTQTGNVLVRLEHYGDYIMSGWDNAPAGEDERGIYFTAEQLADFFKFEEAQVELISEEIGFLAPYYSYAIGASESTDRWYSILYAPYDYLIDGEIFYASGERAEFEEKYREYVYNNYLSLPATTRESMLAIYKQEVIKSGLDPETLSGIELIAWVENYIKNAATYNLKFKPFPEGVDYAVYFLTEAKEGVCRHYATSAVAMYRALGIPARYTVGFSVSAEAGKTVLVKGDRAHAWVEVYINGIGWVTVDPTGSSGDASGGGGDQGGSVVPPSFPPEPFEGEGGAGGGPAAPIFSFISNTSGTVLFKYAHYSDYVANNWNDSSSHYLLDGMKYVSAALEQQRNVKIATTVITPNNYTVGCLLPYYQTSFDVADNNDGSSEYVTEHYIYQLDSEILYQLEGEAAEEELLYRDTVYSLYLSLPQNTKDEMLEIIADVQREFSVDFSKLSRAELILWVEAYIKGAAEYTDDFESCPADEDFAIYFLTVAKKGIYAHFATAATVMYRALGIPARYVTGYSAYATEGENVDVYYAQSYGWVEVYLDGFGWVTVDPSATPTQSEIEKPIITVITPSAEKVYDGGALTANNYEIYGTLRDGHRIEVVVTGSQIEVGESPNAFTAIIYDENGNDVTQEYKINQEFGKLKVSPRIIEIVTESAEKTYNGTPLTNPKYTVEGGVIGLHTLNVSVIGTITEPGTVKNGIEYSIVDSEGRDVSKNYEIVESLGDLTVHKIHLTIMTQGAEKIYDGTPLVCDKYAIEGALLLGHSIKITTTGSITEPGTTDNTVEWVITDSDGVDLTDKYDVSTILGKLAVYSNVPDPVILKIASGSAVRQYDGTPLAEYTFDIVEGNLIAGHSISVTFDASITEPGTKANTFTVFITDKFGQDMTGYYKIEKIEGTLEILKRELVIVTESETKQYDGLPLAHPVGEVVTSVITGHTANVSFIASITDVGEVDNAVKCIVYDMYGNDVSSYYELIVHPGKLTVTPREITVVTGSAHKFYDGSALVCNEFMVSDGSLAVGEYFEYQVTGSQVTPGKSKNTVKYSIYNINKEDKTENYSITENLGVLAVYGDELIIRSSSSTKSYDGNPLTSNNYEITSGVILEGHTLYVNCYGSQTEPGASDNLFDFAIVDEYGADVTWYYYQNCSIYIEYGTLTVTKASLSVKSDNEEKFYDRLPLVGDSYTYFGYLIPGHNIVVDYVGSQTEPGTSKNTINVRIYDDYGNDVTDNYELKVNYGTLSVYLTSITVEVKDAKKEYDGTPLTSEEYELIGQLREGNTIHTSFTQSITEIGKIKNEVEILILDAHGNDVTISYDINLVYGYLEVTKRYIRVETGSAEKVYDGFTLQNPDYIISDNPLSNHVISVFVFGSITEVGSVENGAIISIVNEFGEDVLGYYEIDPDFGTLIINPIEIKIITPSADKLYDGTPLTAKEFATSGSLLSSHNLHVVVTGTITEPGSEKNSVEYVITDQYGEDVTDRYYTIVEVAGTLVVHPIEITLESGSHQVGYDAVAKNESVTIIGTLFGEHTIEFYNFASLDTVGRIDNTFDFVIRDGNGTVIHDSSIGITSSIYNINVINGCLEVTPIDITVVTASDKKIYDGTPLYNHGYEILGALFEDHEIFIEVIGEITEVGVCDNDFTYLITDSEGNNVNHLYNVISICGKLTVLENERIPISIRTASASKQYDGLPLSKHSYEITAGELLGGHNLIVNFNSAITDPGTVKNDFDFAIIDEQGKDVSYLYDVSKICGELTVYIAKLNVSTSGATKQYDGMPLSCDEYMIAGSLLEGHNAYVTVTGIVEFIGKAKNTYEIVIFDSEGNDVTDTYLIISELGDLEITPITITITSEDCTVNYGEIAKNETVVMSGTLFGNHTIEYYEFASLSDIGMIDNTFGFDICDELGNVIHSSDIINADSIYAVNVIYGKLTVNPIEITVTTASAEKTYDGTPLIKDSYEIVGELIAGHNISVTVTGINSNVGSVENTFEYQITDENGENVDGYYRVVPVLGTLLVKPIDIILSSGDDTVLFGSVAKNTTVKMTGELLSGHTIKYTNFAYLDKPGSTSNTFSFVISNEDGEVLYSSADSSNENSIYSVTVEYGTLKVRQVEITVITGNAEKVYDGTPLTNSDYRVEGELLAGHEIRVTVTGTITEIGSIENTFEYVIVDAQGKEIEAPYYLINEELGVLRVLEEKTNPGGSKPSDPPPKAPLPGATPEGPAVPVIEVTADYSGPILLRDAHYGDYEYDYWDIAPAGESKNGLYFTSEAYKYVGANAQTVQIKLLSSAYVLPYYTDKDSVGEVATEYTVQNYYTTQNNLEHSAEWKALEENYREFVYDNYTDLPEETKSQVYTIIMNALNESGAEALILNRYELIYWIESYVRNVAPYDREYPVPSGVDLAVWFLSDPEAAGVCRHFATAAVAAYRALGIPARYVTGYSGTVQNGKTVTITSEQAHAWVEVYYDGIGWLAVDPTGSGNGSGGGGGPLPRPPIEEEEVITDVYIEFKSENVKFTYDGKSHGLDSSMVAAPRTAPKALGGKVIYLDDSLEYEFYGEITEVGSIAAGIKSVRAYDIETGLDVSYKYNFHYNDTIDIIITQIPLNIKSESKITPKDELGSRPLTYNILSDKEFQASSGQTARNISEILLSGHEIVAEFTASLSDYGKTDNVFTVRVFDEYGNDVTKYYAISYRYGTLTVAYDRLVYKTNSYSKEYDKTALVGDVTIADLMNPYDGYIRAGHYIDTASFANASVLTPETKNNIPKFKIRNEYGVDITDLYVIDQSMLGKLTVNPINVTVAAGSKSVDYDPKNPNKKLVCDSYEIVSGKLLEGHRIVATYEGEISKPGLCDSSIKSIKIYDENGNDVTSVYRISTQTGVLEIVA